MNGIITIAFGKEYDRIVAHCLKLSTSLVSKLPPIQIYTNLKEENRDPAWECVKKKYLIDFKHLNYKINYNRSIRMELNKITPFEKTIYLDADAIIKKPLECIFSMLDNSDIVLNCVHHWRKGDRVPNIYIKAFKQFDVHLPVRCYNGGFMAWKTSPKIDVLFNTWHEFWNETGNGRDMPALTCAIQKVDPVIFDVGNAPVFAAERRADNYMIQHNYKNTFFKDFNLPFYQENKWFDSDPSDFRFSIYE